MQNAPPETPVYIDPELGPIYESWLPRLDPDNIRDYLFGGAFIPLAEEPFILDRQPPDRVVLARPLKVPADPFWAELQERETAWLRAQLQSLIRAGDPAALGEQQCQFSNFTRRLLWHMGFEWAIGVDDVVNDRFGTRDLVETAEHLYERHGEVQLRIDLATAEFELRGAGARSRRGASEVSVSLRPVVDALWLCGLWIDRVDARFTDLARVIVRLARDEQRRVGRGEFTRRHSRDGG